MFKDRDYLTSSPIDGVLSNPQILGVPLLLVANKQDSPQSLSVDEIRHDYEDWHQRKLESARRSTYGESDNNSDRRERIASLEVMGVSALEGYVIRDSLIPLSLSLNGGSTSTLFTLCSFRPVVFNSWALRMN